MRDLTNLLQSPEVCYVNFFLVINFIACIVTKKGNETGLVGFQQFFLGFISKVILVSSFKGRT